MTHTCQNCGGQLIRRAAKYGNGTEIACVTCDTAAPGCYAQRWRADSDMCMSRCRWRMGCAAACGGVAQDDVANEIRQAVADGTLDFRTVSKARLDAIRKQSLARGGSKEPPKLTDYWTGRASASAVPRKKPRKTMTWKPSVGVVAKGDPDAHRDLA